MDPQEYTKAMKEMFDEITERQRSLIKKAAAYDALTDLLRHVCETWPHLTVGDVIGQIRERTHLLDLPKEEN